MGRHLSTHPGRRGLRERRPSLKVARIKGCLGTHLRRRGSLPVVALLAIAAVFGMVLLRAFRSTGTSAGPLGGQQAADAVTITGIATDVGRTVSIGIFIPLTEPLPGSLVLDRVELLEASPGLHLAGAYASTGRGDSFSCIGASRQFPPPGCRIWPVEGWRIRDEAVAHGSFQVVLGLSVQDPGVHGYPAVAVLYHSGDAGYRAVYVQGGQLCAPREAYESNGCPDTEAVRRAQEELAGEIS